MRLNEVGLNEATFYWDRGRLARLKLWVHSSQGLICNSNQKGIPRKRARRPRSQCMEALDRV